MRSSWPGFKEAVRDRPFQRRRSAIVTPWARAMAASVSPCLTVYRRAGVGTGDGLSDALGVCFWRPAVDIFAVGAVTFRVWPGFKRGGSRQAVPAPEVVARHTVRLRDLGYRLPFLDGMPRRCLRARRLPLGAARIGRGGSRSRQRGRGGNQKRAARLQGRALAESVHVQDRLEAGAVPLGNHGSGFALPDAMGDPANPLRGGNLGELLQEVGLDARRDPEGVPRDAWGCGPADQLRVQLAQAFCRGARRLREAAEIRGLIQRDEFRLERVVGWWGEPVPLRVLRDDGHRHEGRDEQLRFLGKPQRPEVPGALPVDGPLHRPLAGVVGGQGELPGIEHPVQVLEVLGGAARGLLGIPALVHPPGHLHPVEARRSPP